MLDNVTANHEVGLESQLQVWSFKIIHQIPLLRPVGTAAVVDDTALVDPDSLPHRGNDQLLKLDRRPTTDIDAGFEFALADNLARPGVDLPLVRARIADLTCTPVRRAVVPSRPIF